MRYFFLLFLILSPLPPIALATSFVAQPFPVTVQEAPIIVRGRTGASTSDWGKNPESGKRIYTYTELDLIEVIKGAHVDGPTLTLRELGGQKDGIGLEVAGASHFQPGEDVTVLLGKRNADGTYDIFGLMMGKLNIVRDESGKEFLSGPALNENPESPSDTSAKKWTLEDLRSLVANQESTSQLGSPSDRKASPQPTATPSTASHLQLPPPQELSADRVPDPDAESRRYHWGYAVVALLLAARGIGWRTLRKVCKVRRVRNK